MPLFSDMRGRFFALPDEVLEQYRLPDSTADAAYGAAADSVASASPAPPVAAAGGTTVIIIHAAPAGDAGEGAAERGGTDA